MILRRGGGGGGEKRRKEKLKKTLFGNPYCNSTLAPPVEIF